MPSPNDLTPEEEAEFTAMGVAPAGPGMEPTGETSPPAAPEAPAEAAPARERDPATGRFTATPEETAAGVDPNAPPNPAAAAPEGYVPHAALHAERMKTTEALRNFNLLQSRTNAILAAQRPAVPDLPDINTDPVGYVTQLGERYAETELSRQETEHNRRIDDAFTADEQTFSRYTPDYDQASNHFLQSRANELMAMGATPEQVRDTLFAEVRQIAGQAWQAGVPAAQRIYQLAQARGYAAPAPGAAPVAGAQPAAAPAAQPAPAAVLATVRAQNGASRSLSTASGGAAAQELNAEALLALSDEEFEKVLRLGEKGANARFAGVGIAG